MTDTPLERLRAAADTNDLDELYAVLDAAMARQDELQAAMNAATAAGDGAAWDAAAGEHDDLSDLIGEIESRIWDEETGVQHDWTYRDCVTGRIRHWGGGR